MTKNYPVDKNGLYYLSKQDIENEVESLLLSYDRSLLSSPKPIDIEDFIENHLKLTMEFHKLSKNNKNYGEFIFREGLIIVYDEDVPKYILVKGKTVVIDSQIDQVSEGLFRFTVAHEAGHYLLHFSLFDKGLLKIENNISHLYEDNCNSQNTFFKSKSQWMEWQANYVASCLLMNRQAMIKLIEEMLGYTIEYGSKFLDNISDLTKLLLIDKIKTTFNVSRQAAEIRLKDISGE